MKTFFTTTLIYFSLGISCVFGAFVPEVIICAEDFVVTTHDNPDFFTSAVYNAESEVIAFTTTEDISLIQIFDDEGNMTFQLPIMSDVVMLNKNLFKKGNYKLGFIIEGKNDVYFSSININ